MGSSNRIQLLSDGFTPVAVDIKSKKIVGAALSHVYERFGRVFFFSTFVDRHRSP
jgi:hypothetical protein